MTVTLSSIHNDMLEEYDTRMRNGLSPFSCHYQVAAFVLEFVRTRGCFFHAEGRMPVVEASFAVHTTTREGDMRVQTMPGTSLLHTTIDYFLSPVEEEWLAWDDEHQCFHGAVPTRRAAEAGAGRLDAYTIPLELEAVVTRLFPSNIRLEQVIRIALPLTVRRRPDQCGSPPYRMAAGSPPWLPMDLGRQAHRRPENSHTATPYELLSPSGRSSRHHKSRIVSRSKSAFDLRTARTAEACSTARADTVGVKLPLGTMRSCENIVRTASRYSDYEACYESSESLWRAHGAYKAYGGDSQGHKVGAWQRGMSVGQDDRELPSFQSDL
ncbi:hypothetical protein LTR36_006967 [Oleoguttula mirabilis]|uniref:Uncharacterized protein n=1 Tax=Oleoguttula mirabilis TaxID=1507867 RepID=A0AAV9JBY1_9PEZI|nr:hypothetical protein LTR36_006967 [Oleoguttula mirabilis]